MTWNYRILRHRDGTLALHEVYYDEQGQPRAYTERPAGFAVDPEDGPEGVQAALETALRDARERPVLDAETIADPGAIKIQSTDGLYAEMSAVARGEKPAPADAARPSFNSDRALADYLRSRK